jgi:hypothetical protein
VQPVTAAEATALLNAAYATPPELVQQAIAFMKD